MLRHVEDLLGARDESAQARPAVREEALHLARGARVALARGEIEVFDTSNVLFIACSPRAAAAVGFAECVNRSTASPAFAEVFPLVREAPPW